MIYAIGVIFHQLCYFVSQNEQNKLKFKGQGVYPQEKDRIIEIMLNGENTYAKLFYDKIMEEYFKNVARITSIDSVFRCMFSFRNFTQIMNQNTNTFSNPGVTPISYNLMNYKNIYLNVQDQKGTAIYLNNYRNLLYNNSQINNETEIKPSLVLEFLLEKLNKETGQNFIGPSLRIQPVNFNQNKDQSLAEFMAYYNQNFNLIISQFYVGFIKTKRICQQCREGIYSLDLFPFIEFDLDICAKYPNIGNWFQ